jgi:23S rRNA (guanosine2251-2'-O)-methyltransferase
MEALKARGNSFEKILLAQGRSNQALTHILGLAKKAGVKIERVDRAHLDRLYGGPGHQGVAALVGAFEYATLDDVLKRVSGEYALILILDGIQDPMNLGSLLRSAESAGAAGVVLPKDRAAPVTGTVLKASAGAAEFIPVVQVTNLVRVIEQLRKAGFWIFGTHQDADHSLYETDLRLKLGLVVGGEGKGIRRLVKESCDNLVSIPLKGRVASLNAAVAGAIAMFEYVRQCGD